MKYDSTKIKVSLILIIILVLLIVFSLIIPVKTYSMTTSGDDKQKVVGELFNNDRITQNFSLHENSSFIGFRFATYGRNFTKGKIVVTISNGKKSKKYKIKADKLVDNEMYFLKYNFKKNKKYKIDILIKNTNYPITLYVTYKMSNTSMYLNDKEQDNSLYFAMVYKKSNYFYIWYYSFGIFVLLLYVFLLKNGGRENAKKNI